MKNARKTLKGKLNILYIKTLFKKNKNCDKDYTSLTKANIGLNTFSPSFGAEGTPKHPTTMACKHYKMVYGDLECLGNIG